MSIIYEKAIDIETERSIQKILALRWILFLAIPVFS